MANYRIILVVLCTFSRAMYVVKQGDVYPNVIQYLYRRHKSATKMLCF